MSNIHSTAIISDGAKIAEDVIIGPFCVIGGEVEIDSGTQISSHVVIEGKTKIGKNNKIFPFAILGVVPQDLKFKGEQAKLEIGENNTIREYCNFHLGTEDGGMLTKIGSNNLFMVGVHIAHDCMIGDNIVMANHATMAGHVEVQDDVVIGGLAAVHQFTRIGKGSMIGGLSAVVNDVVPFTTASGERANVAGLNLVGVKRKGYSKDQINDLRAYFKDVFQSNSDLSFTKKIEEFAKDRNSDLVTQIAEFVNSESARQFTQMKK